SPYQPTVLAGSSTGVAMLPSAARPTCTTPARTPIAAIDTRIGVDGFMTDEFEPCQRRSPRSMDRLGIGTPTARPTPTAGANAASSRRLAISGARVRCRGRLRGAAGLVAGSRLGGVVIIDAECGGGPLLCPYAQGRRGQQAGQAGAEPHQRAAIGRRCAAG